MAALNRRQAMLMFGAGVATVATPPASVGADPGAPEFPADPPAPEPSAAPGPPPGPPATPAPQAGSTVPDEFLWHDEFDGPAGSAPDPAKWAVSNFRSPIKNPVGFDRPEYLHQYRDSRENVFLDGNSNLVIRGTREGNKFFGGLVYGKWRGAIGTTWEARIKLECQTAGCWPAWWLSNDDPGRSGEIDILEWYGNGEWPSGTTVHADPYGTAFETHRIRVDSNWHRWRVTWDHSGMYFWRDYAPGMKPYFEVPARGIPDLHEPVTKWPFNDPGYTVFPILNLAIGGTGGGDAMGGSYPADMIIDWVRVF